MTKRNFWLKLLSENDTALMSAIILIERYVTDEQLRSGSEYIQSRMPELNEEVPEATILSVFPDFDSSFNTSNDNVNKIYEFVSQFEDMYYAKLTGGQDLDSDIRNSSLAACYQRVRYFIEELTDDSAEKENFKNV